MNDEHQEQPWWRTPIGLVACGFIIVAGFFLLTEHTAHVFWVRCRGSSYWRVR